LTNVFVSVSKIENTILAPDHVISPLTFKFIAVEKVHDPEPSFHIILEVAFVHISSNRLVKRISMYLIVMPIALINIAIGHLQLALPLFHIIFPHSFVHRAILSMVFAISLANNLTDKLAAIFINHLMLIVLLAISQMPGLIHLVYTRQRVLG